MPAYGIGSGAYPGGVPSTHFLQAWGTPQCLMFPLVASVGANVAISTAQGYTFNPYPYAYLYDFGVQVDASGTPVSGTQGVDVYNAKSGGSSYLSAPVTVGNGLAATTTYSARFNTSPSLKLVSDPTLSPEVWNSYPGQATPPTSNTNTGTATNPQCLLRGAVFSLRAVTGTGGGGSLSNLLAFVVLIVSNSPFEVV